MAGGAALYESKIATAVVYPQSARASAGVQANKSESHCSV